MSHPPPFVYVNDPLTARSTGTVLKSILHDLSEKLDTSPPTAPSIHYARVDAVACFTPRLLYDSILHGLVNWNPTWQEGCSNWNGGLDQKFNDNIDAFVHGLRAVHSHLRKGKTKDNGDGVQLVILIERAERLKERFPELLQPLTRLAELVRLPQYYFDLLLM